MPSYSSAILENNYDYENVEFTNHQTLEFIENIDRISVKLVSHLRKMTKLTNEKRDKN